MIKIYVLNTHNMRSNLHLANDNSQTLWSSLSYLDGVKKGVTQVQTIYTSQKHNIWSGAASTESWP